MRWLTSHRGELGKLYWAHLPSFDPVQFPNGAWLGGMAEWHKGQGAGEEAGSPPSLP